MSEIIKDIKIQPNKDLKTILLKKYPELKDYRILKKSIDARTGHKPYWVYSIEIFFDGEEIPNDDIVIPKILNTNNLKEKPIIIGAGPAGLFCAIRLLERGIPCILIERGSPAEKRIMAINKYWRYGDLDEDDNVCFGEGGAGLYSDGKLITRIKSPHIPYVMDRFVQFGAPEEIKYLSNPHIGSDKIRRLIPQIRKYLIEMGCEIHFNTRVTSLNVSKNSDGMNKITGLTTSKNKEFNSNSVILATGHSETDLVKEMANQGISVEGKSFAMGFRIEHPQSLINNIQYGENHEEYNFGAANYRLTYHNKLSDTGAYSFCMCPGGYVLTSATKKGSVVCNGMSNYKRNSPYANSAIVVSIDHKSNFGDDIFGGLHYRDQIEDKTSEILKMGGGTKEVPAQNIIDFMLQKSTPRSNLKSSSISGIISARLDKIFDSNVNFDLIEAFENFDKKMNGFLGKQTVLHAVESRTSSPIRIPRDPKSFESINTAGLYPAGEGAGYAGGITSAACDGVRIAESIVQSLTS